MMSSMSPVCPMTPNTFTVMHPLHGIPVAYRQQQPLLMDMSICTFAPTTPTTSLSRMVSPTMSPSKTRANPVVSPTKKARKSRIVFEFTTEDLAEYFHLSQREAAQRLGVATVTVKRNCRRLGIVWPYRLMKSKKNVIHEPAISHEDAQRIRQERALECAKAGRSPSRRSRSPSSTRSSDDSDDEAAAEAMMTIFSHSSSKDGCVELTEAGRAFARLPLDCMDDSE